MLKLYFKNSNNDLRFLGEPATESEAWKLISEFLKERDWEVPYIRNWITPDGTLHYDVGSHTEFFELEGYGEYNEENEQIYSPEDVGRALKKISDKLKNASTLSSKKIDGGYGCLECKHFWSKEAYDYQWGMWYFGENRCKKQLDKGLMFSSDTYSSLDLDLSYELAKGECPYFERGQKEIVCLTNEEKRKYERGE